MARSLENMLNSERRLLKRDGVWNPLDDIRYFSSSLSLRCDVKAARAETLRASNQTCCAFGPATHDSSPLLPSVRCTKGIARWCLWCVLLNHDLLLFGANAATRILRRYGDQALALRQRRGEELEGAVGIHHRYLGAVHHHARSRLRLAFHFDHVAVLHERLDLQ